MLGEGNEPLYLRPFGSQEPSPRSFAALTGETDPVSQPPHGPVISTTAKLAARREERRLPCMLGEGNEPLPPPLRGTEQYSPALHFVPLGGPTPTHNPRKAQGVCAARLRVGMNKRSQVASSDRATPRHPRQTA